MPLLDGAMRTATENEPVGERENENGPPCWISFNRRRESADTTPRGLVD